MPSRCVRGRAYRGLPALPQHVAGIRTNHAVDDLHQRALAGSILSDHRVNLARRDDKIDSVIRDNGRIRLANSPQLEPWRDA